MPSISISEKPPFKVPFKGSIYVMLFSLATQLNVGCSGKPENAGKGRGPGELKANGIVVRSKPLSSIYKSSGNLLANEAINVYPEIAGRITAIHFKEGHSVHKGDLLVSLYNEDIAAQIRKLKVQRKLQVTTKERQDQLLAINGISKQEYDNTLTQIASIDADIAYSETQMRKLEIRASFDGIIGLRNVSVGAVVSPATLITTIQQINPLKMDFLVPEQYKGIVKSGDNVYFTTEGSDDTMTTKIIAMQPSADVATHSITMRALVNNNSGNLSPGTFTNVFITLDRKGEAITIPTQCIIPTSRDKEVAVVRNGKVDMVAVQTGERMEATVEILSGLSVGDTVLTTGIMQVKQDLPVSINKMEQ